MDTFSREDILHLAQLAKMQLTQAEAEHLHTEISAIVAFASTLQSVNVEGVEPLYQVNGSETRAEADEMHMSPHTANIIEAFPETTPDGQLAVHAVFTGDSPSH